MFALSLLFTPHPAAQPQLATARSCATTNMFIGGLLRRSQFPRSELAVLEWPGAGLPIREFMLPVEAMLTLRTSTDIKQAARLMIDNDITGCPVLGQQDRIVGVLSRTDLINQIAGKMKFKYSPAKSERYMQTAIMLQNTQDLQVRDVMTASPVTVRSSATMQDAALIMARQRLNRLIVVDGPDEQLVGMISSSDVVRLALCGNGQ